MPESQANCLKTSSKKCEALLHHDYHVCRDHQFAWDSALGQLSQRFEKLACCQRQSMISASHTNISRCPLLNRPLQLPLVLHAQVTLPCCAKHHARRKSGRRAIASTLHPSFVGLCIDKANLKKLAAICSKLASDLLYAGVRTLNPMSTCTATPGAPRSSATEAETVPVRTSVPWPLLGIPLVHCQGQQPLVHAARTQPEALQGHGVSATAVSVEFWMH